MSPHVLHNEHDRREKLQSEEFAQGCSWGPLSWRSNLQGYGNPLEGRTLEARSVLAIAPLRAATMSVRPGQRTPCYGALATA